MALTNKTHVNFKRFLTLSILFFILTLLSSKASAGVTFVDSFSVRSQEGWPAGLAFSHDGTKMFHGGNDDDDIHEYTLSTAWDVSTASYVDAFSIASQDNEPFGITFNNDGTKMFVAGAGSGDSIYEYTLSTAYDVSTASYVDALDVSGQDIRPCGIRFNNDGTKLFMTGFYSDYINEYNLSTAYDISTGSYSKRFSVNSQDIYPRDVQFNLDGTRMFVVGGAGDDINEYKLTTGFDVSTASFVDSLSVASQDGNPFSMAFNNDGSKMFMLGYENDTVNEYTLTTGFDVINTTPTLSSSSPADGATSVGANDNLVLTFSEAVDAESGNIVIKKSSDDSTVETIDVTGAKVSGSGSTTITINPSTTLDGGTDYYITIAATAFDDVDSASYAGFSDSTTLNFTTENSTTDPLTDKDVVGSIEAQTEAPKRILQYVTTPVLNRMDWLRRHRKENDLTNQNIMFQFSNEMLSSLSTVIPVAAIVDDASKLPNNWSMWSEGSISVGNIGDTSLSSSKDISSNGLTIGVDKKIDENTMYGYALRLGRDEVEVGTSGTSLDTETYSLSLYGTFPHEDTKYVDVIFGVSFLRTDHVRKSGSNTLTGERNGRQVFGSLNYSTTFNKDKFNITPNGRLDLGYTELLEYSETGTDALTYDTQQIKTGMASLGIRIDDVRQFNSITLKPNGILEYGANFSPSSHATVSYVSDPSTDYTLSIAHEATHNLRVGLGFDFMTENGLTIMTNYERDQSDNSHSDTLSLGASYITHNNTEYALAMNDSETANVSVNVIKNITWFDLKASLDYDLSSTTPNQLASLFLSKTF